MAVREELAGGELALRGLIHTAIFGFFALLLCRGMSAFASPFATFGAALMLADASRDLEAPSASRSALRVVLAVVASDAAGRQTLTAPALLSLLGGLWSLSDGRETPAQDRVAEIFHRAFIAALAGGGSL